MDTARKAEAGTKRESSVDIHTLPCATQIVSGKLLYSREPSSGLCDDLDRQEEARMEGIHVYLELIHTVV